MQDVYFGVKKTKKFFLDQKQEQWIEFKKLTEGEVAKYEDSIGGRVTMDNQTGKAEIENKIGSDRRALIGLAVCGYNVKVSETEVKSGYDQAEWLALYETMDGDLAKKLFEEVKEFNGFGKKKD